MLDGLMGRASRTKLIFLGGICCLMTTNDNFPQLTKKVVPTIKSF